jgi:hypothetical protein
MRWAADAVGFVMPRLVKNDVTPLYIGFVACVMPLGRAPLRRSPARYAQRARAYCLHPFRLSQRAAQLPSRQHLRLVEDACVNGLHPSRPQAVRLALGTRETASARHD